MKYIERAYPWLLLAPILLPFIVVGGVLYPYLVPKTILFYALSFVSFAAFLVLVAHGRSFYFGRLMRKESWFPAALLFVAYVASLVGIDFYRSFWGEFIRGDGLLTLTCVVVDFYLILLSANRAFAARFLQLVAAVGSLAALYGILEWLIGGGRIGGLLGNAAFFSDYLALTLFANLIVAKEASGGWRKAAYAGAVLEVIAIVLTATRGTVLALIVVTLLFLGYRALRGEGRARRYALRTLLVLLVAGGLFVALRGPLSHLPFAPIARIASAGLSDPDISNRLAIWQHMISEIAKSPWLGVGAEHIDVPFNRFYDPTQITEQWFDRSHNAFLDYWVEFGIAGLLLYLAIIGSFFTTARRYARSGEGWTALMIALLATAYAVQNFFAFDTITTLWLILAMLAVFAARSSDSAPETLSIASWMRGAAWLMATVLVLLLYPVSVKPALAAYDLSQSYKYALVNPALEAQYLTAAYAEHTYGDIESGYLAYDMYANFQTASLSGTDLATAYQAAEPILEQNFARYPYDARTALYLAHTLTLAPAGTSVSPDLLSSSIARAIHESQGRYQPWFLLANLSIAQANASPPQSVARIQGYAAAIDIINRYLALVPHLSEPHYVLAQLLYASGRTSEAAAEAALGKQDYKSGDLSTARRAAGYYETVLDLPDAAYFLVDIVKWAPNDAGAKSDLEKIQTYESQHN